MTRNNYKIFSPGTISNLELKNRIIRSATYEAAMTVNGRITDKMLKIYKDLAEGGAGLIITSIFAVKENGKNGDKQACIYNDSFIKDISKIAEIVHKNGDHCKIVAQLNHVGRQVISHNNTAEPVGPTDLPCPILKKKPRALTLDEIEDIIDAFVNGIIRVKKAGFDGVQLHAAHGYLLSTFLSPYTNKRNDTFGGSFDNRIEIIKRIIFKARKEVGVFPILIKLNSNDHVDGGIDSNSFPQIVKAAEQCGFDAIEVSGAIWDCLIRTEEELGFFPMPLPESRTKINSLEKQSYYLKNAENLDVKIPLILVGGNRNIENLEKIISKGSVDFISMCRPFISEPALPNRWREGAGSDKTDCVSCNACLMTTKKGPICCVLKENRIKHSVLKNALSHAWQLGFN